MRSRDTDLALCSKAREIDVAAFAVDPRAPEWAEFRAHYPGCAECSREIARLATLTAALAGEGSASSAHVSEAELLALAAPSSDLPRAELARLEAHLSGCAPCRTELAVVRRFDLAALSAVPQRRGRFGFRPMLLAAAVVVLAVPTVILIWRNAQETRATPSTSMAAVEPSVPASAVAVAPKAVEPEPAPPVAPPVAPPTPIEVAKEPPIATPPPVEHELAEPVAEPEPPRPILMAARVPEAAPLYAPGLLANGPSVRIGGESRSLGARSATPEALGPTHIGVTSRESPNVYFFLPEATVSAVEVTLTSPGSAEPLLETTFPAPLAAGIHVVSLAQRAVRLRPELDYRWFVALVRDPARRSQDAVTVAGIRYAPQTPDQSARLSAAAAAGVAHLYAESGLWYDAFDELSSWLAAEPDSALLRNHRAALLEQVGLDDAAAFERSAAPTRR